MVGALHSSFEPVASDFTYGSPPYGGLLLWFLLDALWIASAILATVVILRITGYQEAKHRRLAAG